MCVCVCFFSSLIKNSKSYRTAALLIVPATFVSIAVLLFRGLNADQRGLDILLKIQWESLLNLDVRAVSFHFVLVKFESFHFHRYFRISKFSLLLYTRVRVSAVRVFLSKTLSSHTCSWRIKYSLHPGIATSIVVIYRFIYHLCGDRCHFNFDDYYMNRQACLLQNDPLAL